MATSTASATSLVSDPVQRPNPPDAVGIRLVDVPADLVKDPRARQYVVDSLKPGVTVKRRIEVSNKSADALHVAVYPGAADIRRGSFVGAAGSTGNELTTWIKPSRLSLDIPAHSRARDTVTSGSTSQWAATIRRVPDSRWTTWRLNVMPVGAPSSTPRSTTPVAALWTLPAP
ncbi:hypothetical protein [Streptomyces mirabilis]|uniref:hypothetical protein n=1 Tax=Streptomyces mirabilis TaxID=68239 RepID=UPI003685ECD4